MSCLLTLSDGCGLEEEEEERKRGETHVAIREEKRGYYTTYSCGGCVGSGLCGHFESILIDLKVLGKVLHQPK